MTEQELEQDQMQAASEPAEVESVEQQQEEAPKMVPLSALQATRRKLQEAEAKAQLYEDYVLRASKEQQQPEEVEDPNGLVEKQHLQQTTAETKREILETLYQDMNPQAVQEINKYLQQILEKKPWLVTSVSNAPNRYARAFEIVQDYKHLVEPKPSVKPSSAAQDAQRVVQNANKPRSPVEIGRSSQPGGLEYLKSIQGKKEFREYRQKLLQGGV